MGEQLTLFDLGQAAPARVVAAPVVVVEAQEPACLPPVDPRQMDLLGDRWSRVSAAHRALAEFDLDAAADALRHALQTYPGDDTLASRCRELEELGSALQQARDRTGSLVAALAGIGDRVPAYLRTAWHRSVAVEAERECGPGATVGGVPAGWHWLRAGEPAMAEASLRATLAREPADGRARGYLADALTVQGRSDEARAGYRDALATAPYAVDLAAVVDELVRDLPRAAEIDYEIPDTPVEWSAAVGLVAGVFGWPEDLPAEAFEAHELAGLPPGLQFYRWLVRERASQDLDARVACRRAMKALCPGLLAARLRR